MDLAALLEQKGIAGMEQLKAQRQLYRGRAGGGRYLQKIQLYTRRRWKREGRRFGEQPAVWRRVGDRSRYRDASVSHLNGQENRRLRLTRAVQRPIYRARRHRTMEDVWKLVRGCWRLGVELNVLFVWHISRIFLVNE